MAKKTPIPRQAPLTTELSFEDVMKLAATTPKAVVDERIKQAKKKQGKKSR